MDVFHFSRRSLFLSRREVECFLSNQTFILHLHLFMVILYVVIPNFLLVVRISYIDNPHAMAV